MRRGTRRGRRARRHKNKRSDTTKGPPEYCECPKCGYTVPHQRKLPCYQTMCPKCGSTMTRKFSTGD